MSGAEKGWTFAGAGVTAGLVLAVLLTGCESGPEQFTYVETLGRDTLAVEQLTRWPDELEGRIVEREPVTRLGHYTARLDARGASATCWRSAAEVPHAPRVAKRRG